MFKNLLDWSGNLLDSLNLLDYLFVSKGSQLNITRRNQNKEHQTVTETKRQQDAKNQPNIDNANTHNKNNAIRAKK